MFVNRCVSLLLSIALSIDSSMVYFGPIQHKEFETTETVPEQIVYEVVETPDEIIQETELIISKEVPFSDAEIDLIALVTMAEAEGECEEGKRLVIDVILNRVDSPHFSNTVESVIYAKNAFECMWNGRTERCYVRDDIRQLVIEEIQNRTNYNVHYFRTNHYHSFGKPVVQVGNHYFSTY